VPRRGDTDELHRRDPVVAVKAIGDIAEGTHGQVKAIVGQAWTRYLIRWDSGEWTGTVDGTQVVREDRVDQYRVRQAELAAAKSVVVASAVPSDAPAGGGDGGRVPEHLLERSRQARARAAAKAEA
jgi:hypothetical protein